MNVDKNHTRSGVWCFRNKNSHKRFIVSSNNINFSLYDYIKKFYYKDKRLDKQLVKDYWSNQLVFEVLEYCQNDPIIMSIVKQHYCNKFSNRYNTKVKKWFVSFEPKQLIDPNTLEERFLVFVKLKPKQKNSKNEEVVGVFETMKEAKEWSRWAYGEYDKRSIDRIVVCNNATTKRMSNSPLITDKHLVNLYKKVYGV